MPFSTIVTDESEDLSALLSPLYERYQVRGVTASNEFTDASLIAALDTPGLTIVLLTDPSPAKEEILRRHLPRAMLSASHEASDGLVGGTHPTLLVRIRDAATFPRLLDGLRAGGFRPLRR